MDVQIKNVGQIFLFVRQSHTESERWSFPFIYKEQITSVSMKARRVCHVFILTARRRKADAEMIPFSFHFTFLP